MDEDENICYNCIHYSSYRYDEYDFGVDCNKGNYDLIYIVPKACPDYTPKKDVKKKNE